MKILLVGCGGFFGSIGRYLVYHVIHQRVAQQFVPYGTLAVNVVGCFAIGALLGLSVNKTFLTENNRMLWITGFLGGFTTFSAFGFDTFFLVREGRGAAAAINVLLNVVVGFLAVWAGHSVARAIS